MKLDKILKIIGAIVAIAGVIAAVYVAIQKLTDKKEPEYFDDNDFFECDNEIEINGKIYQMLDKSFKRFFGQNVEFYAKEDTASGREIITTMAPADKNEVIT